MSAHNTTTEFLGFTQSTRNYYRLPNSRFDLWAWVRDRLNPSRIDGSRVRRDDARSSSENLDSFDSFAPPCSNYFPILLEWTKLTAMDDDALSFGDHGGCEASLGERRAFAVGRRGKRRDGDQNIHLYRP